MDTFRVVLWVLSLLLLIYGGIRLYQKDAPTATGAAVLAIGIIYWTRSGAG